jgi:hypothetical protein
LDNARGVVPRPPSKSLRVARHGSETGRRPVEPEPREATMKYMLAIYETAADFSARTDEHKDAFWGAYHQALVQGVIAGD